ncbi:uncharacterized protein LOC126758456 [Bactrocera neohumeralis]|uniref:uncharacterized protein LOC120773531 n=1 Tax=Bactrocera tryoni TaxID=59916 RepID=UPI001A9987B3|nr:uncharacterized protein LOC120773531 [Bactrocera tryoni]XP_050328682.1 uncharacterized protein LOC126758456 [Bactrocera neohumeralis]
MYYGICWLCALLAGGQLIEATTKAHRSYRDDAHPGKCTLNETVILSPGESEISTEFCGRYDCLNREGVVEIAICGIHRPSEGCEWGDPKDENAPYPKCCERYQICA